MTWADEIDVALRRSGGDLTSTDLLRWLRCGEAVMFISGEMHGSVWFRDGGAELAHVAGKWCDGDAKWLLSKALAAAHARGVDYIEANGRPGWQRFLKLRGFEHGRVR